MSSFGDRHFLAIAAAISIGCGALFAFLIRNGWFAEDDFLNLSEARDSGLTLAFLADPIQGTRFSPGHRFLDWLVLQFPGHEWLAVIALSGICLAASCFLVSQITMETTGSATAALTAALLLGSWVGWVRIGSWWATSAHTLPMMAFALGAIYTALVWDSRGRRMLWLVVSGVLTAAALAFSLRAALVPLVTAALLIIGRPPTRSLTAPELKERIRLCWPPVLLGALATVIFLVIELRQQTSSDAIRSATPSEWISFIAKWMFEGLPAVVTNALSLTIPGDALQISFGLLLTVVLVLTTNRGSRSTSLWIVCLLLILATAAQTGVARLGAVGTNIAYDSRYHEGDVLVIVALIPVIWAAAGKPLPLTPRRRLGAGVLLLAFAGCWTISGYLSVRDLRTETGFSPENPGVLPRATYETLRGTLPGVVKGSQNPTLVNTSTPLGFAPVLADRGGGGVWLLVAGDVPGTILNAFFPRYELTRWSQRGTPVLIEDSGRAVRLRPVKTYKLPAPTPSCLKTSPKSRWLTKGSAGFSVPLPPRRGELPALVTLSFKQPARPGPVAIVFDTGDRKRFPDLQVDLGPRNRGIRMAIPPDATSVGIGAWGGLTACLKTVSISSTR